MNPTSGGIPALFPKTSDRCYAACKFATDPLYPAVATALAGRPYPLLDIGCGLGLLAFYLRHHGFDFPITGLDYDARKILSANETAHRAGTKHVVFQQFDARQPLPDHQGNVTMLDILQFFRPEEQATLLRQAAQRLVPNARLVIRSGVRDASFRYSLTHAADVFAKLTFWMKSAPIHYPTLDFLSEVLGPLGDVEINPLWGKTPFNNHLVVLTKRNTDVA